MTFKVESEHMKYWLMKSDVDDYSIDDLKRDGKTAWVGVRNFQARNFMQGGMRVGDMVLFYHSNADPSGVAGIGKVVSKPYPDSSQFDKKGKYYEPRATKAKPVWFLVDVSFVKKFKRFISIGELRANLKLKNMKTLQSGSRLSITPLTKQEFEVTEKLGV